MQDFIIQTDKIVTPEVVINPQDLLVDLTNQLKEITQNITDLQRQIDTITPIQTDLQTKIASVQQFIATQVKSPN